MITVVLKRKVEPTESEIIDAGETRRLWRATCASAKEANATYEMDMPRRPVRRVHGI